VLLRFWPHTRPDRPQQAAAAALLVTAAGCDAAVVWMFTSIIDGALSEGRLSALWQPAALWAVLIIVGGGLTTAGGWILGGPRSGSCSDCVGLYSPICSGSDRTSTSATPPATWSPA
jgi:ABC-type multidrug transport system fused ATPase/permease subunit